MAVCLCTQCTNMTGYMYLLEGSSASPRQLTVLFTGTLIHGIRPVSRLEINVQYF